jgi:hypothetical protein
MPFRLILFNSARSFIDQTLRKSSLEANFDVKSEGKILKVEKVKKNLEKLH